MSKRQALGVITNKTNQIQQRLPNTNNANLIKQVPASSETNKSSARATPQQQVSFNDDFNENCDDSTRNNRDTDLVYGEEVYAMLDACKLSSIERENVLMNCEEYAKDILVHLRHLELVNRPKASYIKQQKNITSTRGGRPVPF